MYVNRSIFPHFLSDLHPPAATLHLSLTSAGRLVRWPALQSPNFASNFASLTETERESPRCLLWKSRRLPGDGSECPTCWKNTGAVQSADPGYRSGVSALLDALLTSVRRKTYSNTVIDTLSSQHERGKTLTAAACGWEIWPQRRTFHHSFRSQGY